MRIIIVGAGFTGIQLAKRLISEGNDIVIIEKEEDTVRHTLNFLDCMVIQATGNNLDTLIEAGIAKADALVAVTSSDEVNMITCSLVQSVYPELIKIARVRNDNYYSTYKKNYSSISSGKSLYGIDFMVHPDIEAAKAITTAVRHGAVTDVLEFENADYSVFCMTVEEGSAFDGIEIQNIKKLTKDVPFLLAYVIKDGEPSIPTGSTVLKGGDRIGILTNRDYVSEFLLLCGSDVGKIRKIAIVGAGRIGTLIANGIINPKKESVFSDFFGLRRKNRSEDLMIIESDPERVKAASERFPDAKVFLADITDEGFVEEEVLGNVDLVIAATSNHELNMVTAAYLKSLGIEHTIALVASSNFAFMANNIGIDVAVPIKDAVVDSILGHLRGDSVTGIHSVSGGELEITEITLPEDWEETGTLLKEIAKPGLFVVLLVKKHNREEYFIPSGDTELVSNDKLVVLIHSENLVSVLETFGVTQ